MRIVRLHFDPISPYSWLAWRQLPAFEKRTGVTCDLVPVLFAGLLGATENKGPAEIPPKRAYTFLDVARWAAMLGLRYEGPPAHPFNPLGALRMCCAVENAADRRKLAGAILIACWENGVDITTAPNLRKIADDVGLDGVALIAATEDPAVKERVRDNTEALLAAGGFGVPTFVIDNQIFWGADRMPMLEAFLLGKLVIDEAHLVKALARPRAADRKPR